MCLSDEDAPRAAKFAPNGSPYTLFKFTDANAMYLWCMDQKMPTSPGIFSFTDGNLFKIIGILWSRKSSRFHKSVMGPNTSLGAVQWLEVKGKLQVRYQYYQLFIQLNRWLRYNCIQATSVVKQI